MRNYLIFAIIFGSLPICFLKPYVGVLVWSWIGYMNPHRLTWGSAYWFPFAQVVAIATLLGFVLRGRKKLPLTRETVLLIALCGMFAISLSVALYPEQAWEKGSRAAKILLMSFLTISLFDSREKLRHLLWIIVLSFGFYGFKGCLFGIISGGQYRVYGPPFSMIADNNAIAFALNMCLPIFFFMARDEQNKKLKALLYVLFLTSIPTVLFTYSRGGFLGLGLVLLFLGLHSQKKLLLSLLLIPLLAVALAFMPEKWSERMSTISTYQEDKSAMGRINAWYFAWNLALDRPLTGGGFNTFEPDLFEIYAPDPDDFHDSHSIFFEMLAEQGFVGLGLYLALLAACMLSLRKLKKKHGSDPPTRWIADYSNMLQGSLVGYVASGAFLGKAYFDLFYHIVAMVIVLKELAKHGETADASVAVQVPEHQASNTIAIRFADYLWTWRMRRIEKRVREEDPQIQEEQ